MQLGKNSEILNKFHGTKSNLNSIVNLNSIISQLLLRELANLILNFLNKLNEISLSGQKQQLRQTKLGVYCGTHVSQKNL